jgi:hypothetical protein
VRLKVVFGLFLFTALSRAGSSTFIRRRGGRSTLTSDNLLCPRHTITRMDVMDISSKDGKTPLLSFGKHQTRNEGCLIEIL